MTVGCLWDVMALLVRSLRPSAVPIKPPRLTLEKSITIIAYRPLANKRRCDAQTRWSGQVLIDNRVGHRASILSSQPLCGVGSDGRPRRGRRGCYWGRGTAVGGGSARGAGEGTSSPVRPSTVPETTPSVTLQKTCHVRSASWPTNVSALRLQSGHCAMAARSTAAGPIRRESTSIPGLVHPSNGVRCSCTSSQRSGVACADGEWSVIACVAAAFVSRKL